MRSALTQLTLARVAKLSLNGLGENAALPAVLALTTIDTSPLGKLGSELELQARPDTGARKMTMSS
jgi:hypothetical protein